MINISLMTTRSITDNSSAPNVTTTVAPDDDDGLSAGEIASIAVSVALFVLFVVAVVVVCLCYNLRRRSRQPVRREKGV